MYSTCFVCWCHQKDCFAAVAEPAVGSNRKATGSMFGFAEWMCCFRIKRVLLSVVLKRR